MASKVPVVKTPKGILSFPTLFSPQPVQEGGDPRFSLMLVFDEEAQRTPEFKALKAACKQAAEERWGDKLPRDMRSPFRSCGEKDFEPHASMGESGVFISAWTKRRPGIVDASRQEILDAEDVYSGQLARITCRPFAYEVQGNRGVSLGLQNVQILADGERLDGRQSAQSDFDDEVSESASDTDEDDMPF